LELPRCKASIDRAGAVRRCISTSARCLGFGSGRKLRMVKLADVPAIRMTVTLADVAPPVWREVILPGAWHLGKVHAAVQLAMGWDGSHLHEFEAGDLRWGQPDPAWGGSGEVRREVTARLHEVLVSVGDVLAYTYDFGDDWRHELRAIELLPPTATATCLAGEGACPPEDCGGPWGYQELLEILADRDHPEHADRLEWTGGPIDPTRFDLASVAGLLRAMP